MISEKDLLGIGEVGNVFATISADARRAVVEKVNSKYAPQVLTRGQKFLLAKAAGLTNDLRGAIQNGSMKFTDESYYFRSILGNFSGSMPLIDGSQVVKVGLTNLQNGKIAANTALAVMAIGLKISLGAAGQTDPTIQQYSNMEAALPASFQNGELQLQIGGKNIPNLPLKDFFAFGDTVVANGIGRDRLYLHVPLLLRDDTSIVANLVFPTAGTVPATKVPFAEISFYGDGIRVS